MNEGTAVKFIWKKGVPFGRLAKLMVDYFQRANLRFSEWPEYGGKGIFMFNASNGRLEFTNTPWKEDPLLKEGFRRLLWQIREPDGAIWGDFNLGNEFNQEAAGQNRATKAYYFCLSFEGTIWTNYAQTPAEFEQLRAKYFRIKDLFALLDCDEVFAEPGEITDGLRQMFPLYREKIFRLAKEGTQVLVRQMEEGRSLSDVDWLQSRIFIDPPGIHGLSPAE